MFNALLSSNVLRTAHSLSVSSTATLNNSLVAFRSASLASEGWIALCGGQRSRSEIQFGSFHQSSLNTTSPSLLATSAGFSWEGTCLYVISGCATIFCTRFSTNVLYCPLPWIQYRATELSSHPLTPDTDKPSSATFTFISKLVAICAEINSRRGVDKPCLASLA